MIRLNDVVAGYTPNVDILKGISLEVSAKEIVTLLGPNGCGKSTLLKCIAGYLLPRAGSVIMNGNDVSQLPIHHKVRHCSVGFVPQTDNVFTHLSIKDNLLTGGQFMDKQARAERIDSLCATYPILKKRWKNAASAMSGGERQILALARALMPSPEILLLDEPSAGLSPKTLQDVFHAIEEIREQEGVTILMVEQNAIEALRMSDRAYVLAAGQVALTGKAQDILHDPKMQELYLGGRAA